MIVYTKKGTAYDLADTPMASGGEGSVHKVSNRPGMVAKLYKAEAETHRSKIEAMESIGLQVRGTPSLSGVAWPMKALYSDLAATSFVGFAMKDIQQAMTIDKLYDYSPASSSGVSMREKVDFLITLCDLVDALHQLGQVIGDFNNSNVLMIKGTGKGKAGLVDADSFHACIKGTTYRCIVCKDGYVAPEILRATRGTTYAECALPTFTTASDLFSLAIHIFRTLFNGAHPYGCVGIPGPGGSVPAPKRENTRVEQCLTPFFKNIPGYETPKYAPEVSEFPSYLIELFKRAFVEGHTSPSRRPTARDWKPALTRYRSELVQCKHNKAHWHWKGASSCPYCKADARMSGVMNELATKNAEQSPRPKAWAPPAASSPQAAPRAAASAAWTPQATSSFAAAATSRTQTPAKPTTNDNVKFWAATVGVAACVFILLGELLPLCSAISYGYFKAYPAPIHLIFLAGAITGALTYWLNTNKAREINGQGLLLTAATAAAGIGAVALLPIALIAAIVVALIACAV